MNDAGEVQIDSVDGLCRRALAQWRLDAFDNVDVERMLSSPRIDHGRAAWIGNHLLRSGRSLAAYQDGRAILMAIDSSPNRGDAA